MKIADGTHDEKAVRTARRKTGIQVRLLSPPFRQEVLVIRFPERKDGPDRLAVSKADGKRLQAVMQGEWKGKGIIMWREKGDKEGYIWVGIEEDSNVEDN